MSFNVTQCPACESTFNTNSRVLAAAAGRVRCGACLNVFEAIDNFLIPEEADAASDQDESVFVGNDPQEFFDPSSFLTRSALSETHGNKLKKDDPVDEQNLHQQLEQSETVNADFFATVAGELQGKTEPVALENPPAEEIQLHDQLPDRQPSIEPENIDADFEEEILDSFTAQTADSIEVTENGTTHTSFEEPVESEPAPTAIKDTHIESQGSYLGSALSASFTFNPYETPKARIEEPESESAPAAEATNEQPIDLSTASDGYTELDQDNELLPLDAQPEAPEEEAQVLNETISSQVTDEVTDSISNDQSTETFSAEQASTDSLPSVEPSATLPPSTDFAEDDEQLLVDSELPSDETAAVQSLITQEELPSESVVEDDTEDAEPAIEAAQTNSATVDEESTEAIRTRALEAELNDEEALEAIPRENLAALGSMSTPVELLGRRESRLARNTLLFLSILLLGGLLSSQYLWQRMELYSQLPQLRPLYETACSYLNCSLPEYTDIDAIRSENLTVQTHPTLANGLMVNTVMRNTAPFEQPFPILILSFNSSENSVIALREFTSAEYLDPGLRSVQVMPAQTPVQIGLAIMDPGPEAVNYTLAFRWP